MEWGDVDGQGGPTEHRLKVEKGAGTVPRGDLWSWWGEAEGQSVGLREPG